MTEILPSAGEVVYAVDLDADAAIEAPFDTWLRDHVADVMQVPGFLSAEILDDPAPPEGRVRRTVQPRMRDGGIAASTRPPGSTLSTAWPASAPP